MSGRVLSWRGPDPLRCGGKGLLPGLLTTGREARARTPEGPGPRGAASSVEGPEGAAARHRGGPAVGAADGRRNEEPTRMTQTTR